MQQVEYLRPMLDTQYVLVGVSTTGTLLTIPDFYPNLDVPVCQFAASAELQAKARRIGQDAVIEELYRKAGLPSIKTMRQLNFLTLQDQIFSNQCCLLSPFVNEFTIDMLPTAKTTLSPELDIAYQLNVNCDVERLKVALRKRAKTIPQDGLVYKFVSVGENLFVHSIKFKEIVFADEVVVLYRLNTANGDTPGYYKPSSGTFVSIMNDIRSNNRIAKNTERFVLYLYTAAVTRGGGQMLKAATDVISFVASSGCRIPYSIQVLSEESRLATTAEVKQSGIRINDEKYEHTARNMSPIIRRLPLGQKASVEAKERAAKYGYELEENETFVRPHVRSILHLKLKEA